MNSSTTDNQPDDLEKRLVELRGRISDLGYEADAGKAVDGLTMGGGVFVLLLGLLAAYDLLNGRTGIYAPLGITRDLLQWIAWGGIGLGALAILRTVMRRRRRDRSREIELAALEEEYARLNEGRDAQSSDES
ncbi:MAG: hypothetical protein ACJ74J_23890 [Blastocatellia bacterium]